MLENDEINVGIYVRVSTEEQAKEGYSIGAQTDKLKDYAKIMGWNIYSVYSDEGISGKNITARPQINRMIKDIISKKINAVLVFKVDRLTRSTKDLIELVEIFNKNNCSFVSLMESIDTKTASGRMFLKIIGIFAEFERENLIERVTVAFEKKAKDGYSLCSYTASYGYDREKGNKIQSINEEEAKIVKEIFDMFVNKCYSTYQIMASLNTRGIKTKKGTAFNTKTILLILSNPNYIGKVRYAMKDKSRYFEVEGKHEAIIDLELWEKAQEKLSKIKRKTRTKHPKEENYFIGSLYCGICGRRLATHRATIKLANGTVKVIPMYRCVNKMNKICTAKDMSHQKVESAFIKYIENIEDLEIPEDFKESNEDNVESSISEEELEKLRKKLNQLETKESDIMKLYIDESINFEAYTKMIKIVTEEKTNIANLLEQITEQKLNSTNTEITENDIITNMKENWELLTDKEKMDFLTYYVERIEVVNEPQNNTHMGIVKIKKIDFIKY